MLETLCRNGEVAYWRDHVTGDFRPLALLTFTGPFGHVLTYRRPDEFRADRLTSPFDAGVAETVYGVENSATPRERYVRSCRTVGYVDEYFGLTQIHFFKVEARAGVVGKLNEFWVENLLASHFVQIDVDAVDCVDDRAEIVEFFGWDGCVALVLFVETEETVFFSPPGGRDSASATTLDLPSMY